jgi:hypothetical protein
MIYPILYTKATTMIEIKTNTRTAFKIEFEASFVFIIIKF